MDTKTRPAVGTTYRSGETNPVKGEFACVPCEDAGKKHMKKFDQGDKFPECDNVATTWRLVSYT